MDSIESIDKLILQIESKSSTADSENGYQLRTVAITDSENEEPEWTASIINNLSLDIYTIEKEWYL